MKIKYYRLDTSLMTGKGLKIMTVFYKFENDKWYNKFPDENKWGICYDPFKNKWPHDKLKEITEAEAFISLI